MSIKRNRPATEQKIYEAFLELLEEEGFRAVGINAIARRAQVDKNLVYRYYGGLEGILLRYAKEGDFFEMLTDEHMQAEWKGEDTDPREFLKTYLIRAIRILRQQTHTQEILRWQLSQNDDTTKSLFKFANRQIVSIFKAKAGEGQVMEGLVQTMPLLVSGLLYLVLMSKHHRYFMELDLSSDQGWERIEAMIATVIDAVT